MRTPRREQGRYASLSGLSIIRNAVDAPFPLIVIDRSGRPVPHLTEYYRLSLLDNVPHTTVDTYFGLLLPVFSYFLDHGWDWCRPPDDIRQYLTQFFRDQLHCKISSATVQEGYRISLTRASPIAKSTLGVLWAALRDFYTRMETEHYYAYANPLVSALLQRLRREHRRDIQNSGAPDYAGIRSEPHAITGRQPTAFFRAARADLWTPDERIAMPEVMTGIDAAIDAMLEDTRLSLRERCVIGLLRNTGARAFEICTMTIGGYRSFKTRVVLGQARVANKGSHGIESKDIYFHAAPQLQLDLERYLREERLRWDRDGHTSHADLPNNAPLFITRQGTAYTYECFKWACLARRQNLQR